MRFWYNKKANMPVKVGFLVSYDYEYLKFSIPQIYEDSDEIYLAIDRDFYTWSGSRYLIDPDFFQWLKEFDKLNKITIYREKFYLDGYTPLELETRERNMLGKYMGEGGWHLQIDSDEYFSDFKAFIVKLRNLEKRYSKTKLTITARLITIFKITAGGFLLVQNSEGIFNVATNYPIYKLARAQNCEKIVNSNVYVLHQNFSRSEDELQYKMKNWGHKNDFNVDSYFKLWKLIDEYNYKYVMNFHPLGRGSDWPSLILVPVKSIEELILGIKNGYIKTTSIDIKLKDFFPPVFVKILKYYFHL